MGRVFPVVVCALLPAIATSCAQLVGIDETSNTGRTDTATLTRVSIGATVELAPLDLTGQSASYFDVSGSQIARVPAVRGDAPGTWTVHLPDPAPIEVTQPDDPQPSQFALPSAAVELPIEAFEHPDPVPAGADATIALAVTLDAASTATDALLAVAIGPWTVRGFSADEVPLGSTSIALTYPYSTSSNLVEGATELAAITAGDAYLILRYNGTALTGAAAAAPFAQTGADTVTATMVPVTADQRVQVKVDPPTLESRYSQQLPAVTGLSMTWQVSAAPGYQRAQPLGPLLMSGSLGVADVGVDALYGNPFVDRPWHPLFVLNTAETRVYTPASGMLAVVLGAEMQQFIEPGSDVVSLDLPAGLPKLISLGGVQLIADGQTVAAPHDFVEVGFSTDNANATLYGLEVLDIVANTSNTALDLQGVYHATGHATGHTTGRDPTFQIPAAVFQAGHSYTIRAVCMFQGFPQIDTGDLVTRELPFAQSSFDSAVFTVMP